MYAGGRSTRVSGDERDLWCWVAHTELPVSHHCIRTPKRTNGVSTGQRRLGFQRWLEGGRSTNDELLRVRLESKVMEKKNKTCCGQTIAGWGQSSQILSTLCSRNEHADLKGLRPTNENTGKGMAAGSKYLR